MKVQVFSLKLVKEGTLAYKTPVDTPSKSSKILCSLLKDKDRENFAVLALDIKLNPVGINIVSIGTLSSTPASPREVFKFAILSNAGGIVLAHNHPSGDLTPSDEDLSLTRNLVKLGREMQIPVHDHIITHRNRWVSLRTAYLDLFN